MRVYEDDALAAADRADARLAAGDASPLCGVPVGLKDLYAVAGKPLTASSRLLDEVPERSCDAWARLEAAGMVLLGHLHTHEFAAGGTTDQVGNPWALDRSAGGSSGGSAAALAARMTPAATGTDTAGSLRIPSAFCGTSAFKPTRGSVPIRGHRAARARRFDHAGPMARSLEDCEPLLAALCGREPSAAARAAAARRRLAPARARRARRATSADGFDAALDACRASASSSSTCRRPTSSSTSGSRSSTSCAPRCSSTTAASTTGASSTARRSAASSSTASAARCRRRSTSPFRSGAPRTTASWLDWFAEHRIDALLEPTVPIVARPRGHGYDEAFTDVAEISLTHYWDWTGFPVAALPSGVGRRSGLPVGVSLIGAAQSDWDVLAAGIALQSRARNLGNRRPANA